MHFISTEISTAWARIFCCQRNSNSHLYKALTRCWAGFSSYRKASPPTKHSHPQLVVERMSHNVEELVARVCGQAVHKQAEEDGCEDLTQKHTHTWLVLLCCCTQETDQGTDTCSTNNNKNSKKKNKIKNRHIAICAAQTEHSLFMDTEVSWLYRVRELMLAISYYQLSILLKVLSNFNYKWCGNTEYTTHL